MNSSKKRGSGAAIALAVGLATFACGGRATSGPGDTVGGEPPSPSIPAAPTSPPASTGSATSPPVATAPPSRPTAVGACATDSDCDDPSSGARGLGTCWPGPAERDARGGSCLCRADAVVQRSGKCGFTPPPSCEAQGGSCLAWSTCSGGGGFPADAQANGACSADGSTTCCIPFEVCRSTSITSCYRKGTDAAYVPPCINGWMTCHPGDSPALQL